MAITFTGLRLLTSGATTAPWNGQTQASLRCRLRFDGDPTAVGNVRYVSRNGDTSVYLSFVGVGSNSTLVRIRFSVKASDGTISSTTSDVTIGATHDLCVAHDGSAGTQKAWVDGALLSLGTRSGTTGSGNVAFGFGIYGAAPGSGCVYTLEDVCAWDGYALTGADAVAMRGGTDPATIGTGATARYRWTMAIPNGKAAGDAVAASDVPESMGHTALNMSSLTGSGSSVWASPLVWSPSVQTGWARTGTSGKTIFVGLQTVTGGVGTIASAINTTPTITVNGASRGSLAGGLASGYATYCAFEVPGATLNPGDVVTLDAPVGWATAEAGVATPMESQVVTVYTGQSAGFRTPGYTPQLRMGINFDSGPTSNLAAGPYLKNLAWRLGGKDSWQNVSAWDATGKPTAMSASPAYTGLVNSPQDNGLDSTEYPGPVGLFAVGWDDLDPAHPTTFGITSGSGAISTVTERADMANPGVGGIGNVRIFNVQRAGNSVRTYIQLRMYCASLAPKFANLVVYAPGDFAYTDGQPVTLPAVTDPHEFSLTVLDRIQGVGSIRAYSPIIDGPRNNVTEWGHSRHIDDWTYGDNTTKVTLAQGWTSAQAYDPGTWPWIYHPATGSKYAATLASSINSTVTTLTISDAATAPVIVGLRLFVDSEVMRVAGVSGTTVTVERACHGTTAASHAAGSIQVGYRFASPTLGSGAFANGTWHILTSQDPHGLVTGNSVWPRGAGWPASVDCTNGVTMLQTASNPQGESQYDWTNVNAPVMVTGPNTILWGGGPGTATASVLLSTLTLDPVTCYSSKLEPDSAQIPYGVHAKLANVASIPKVWYAVPHAATDDFCWQAAREARDNLLPGKEVWVELGNEVWHFQPAWAYCLQMTSTLYPGQAGLAYYARRSREIADIWVAAFNEGGRNRGSEIKLYLNLQAVYPGGFNSLMLWTAAQGIKIDGVAIAPYISWNYMFHDAPTVNYFAGLAVDQVLDHWIFNQWFQPATNTNCFRRYTTDWLASISTYNATTGNTCQLLGYEGGLDSIFPHQDYPSPPGTPLIFAQDDWNERRRDFGYHPNLYIVMQDWFALLQELGFKQFNYFDLDNAVHLSGSGEYLWGMYKGYQQPHGRGDGSVASDGAAHDNRLCVAEPGQAHTKAATTSLDATNISVMGQAMLDWNSGATSVFAGWFIPTRRVSR